MDGEDIEWGDVLRSTKCTIAAPRKRKVAEVSTSSMSTVCVNDMFKF